MIKSESILRTLIKKKFFRGSFIFGFTNVLFSIIRQILFFPILASISEIQFQKISFLIVLIETIFMGSGAFIADFYVRKATEENAQPQLFGSLQKLLWWVLLFVPIPLLYGYSTIESFLFVTYLLFFSKNALYLKPIFNKLQFEYNTYYIAIKSTPYIVLYILMLTFELKFQTIQFLLFISVFEFIFYLFLRNTNKELIKLSSNLTAKIISSEIIFFGIGYVLFALVQKMDLLFTKSFHINIYNEYFQAISISLVFVNPVIVFTSASLLSYLTLVKESVFLDNRKTVLIAVLIIAVVCTSVFFITFDFVLHFFYPKNMMASKLKAILSVFIFSSIFYFISKTFAIKYLSQNKLILSLVASILIPFIFFKSFELYLLTFFILRAFSMTLLVFVLDFKKFKI